MSFKAKDLGKGLIDIVISTKANETECIYGSFCHSPIFWSCSFGLESLKAACKRTHLNISRSAGSFPCYIGCRGPLAIAQQECADVSPRMKMYVFLQLSFRPRVLLYFAKR